MSLPIGLPLALVPGNSVAHRLNPLAKIVWVVGYTVLAFATDNLVTLYAMAAFAVLVGLASGVGPSMAKGAVILIPLGSSLMCLQTAAPTMANPTVLADIGPFTLYAEGIYQGLLLLGRIMASLLMALLLVMTTHPSDLFTALGKLKVPYTLNFMLAMTLQLIPVLQREAGIVMSAQKSRGMKGTGFGAVLPSFIPVFVGAFERVQQLSISLESRGFGSSGHKTSYRQVKNGPVDWVVGLVAVAVITPLVVHSVMHYGSIERVVAVSPGVALAIFLGSALTFFAFIGYGIFVTTRK